MHSFDGEPYIRDKSLYVSMHLTKQQNHEITKQQKCLHINSLEITELL